MIPKRSDSSQGKRAVGPTLIRPSSADKAASSLEILPPEPSPFGLDRPSSASRVIDRPTSGPKPVSRQNSARSVKEPTMTVLRPEISSGRPPPRSIRPPTSPDSPLDSPPTPNLSLSSSSRRRSESEGASWSFMEDEIRKQQAMQQQQQVQSSRSGTSQSNKRDNFFSLTAPPRSPSVASSQESLSARSSISSASTDIGGSSSRPSSTSSDFKPPFSTRRSSKGGLDTRPSSVASNAAVAPPPTVTTAVTTPPSPLSSSRSHSASSALRSPLSPSSRRTSSAEGSKQQHQLSSDTAQTSPPETETEDQQRGDELQSESGMEEEEEERFGEDDPVAFSRAAMASISSTLEQLMEEAHEFDEILRLEQEIAVSSRSARRQVSEGVDLSSAEQDARRMELAQYVDDIKRKVDPNALEDGGMIAPLVSFPANYSDLLDIVESEQVDAREEALERQIQEAEDEENYAAAAAAADRFSNGNFENDRPLSSRSTVSTQPPSTAGSGSGSSRVLNTATAREKAPALPDYYDQNEIGGDQRSARSSAPSSRAISAMSFGYLGTVAEEDDILARELQKIRELDLLLAKKTKEARAIAKRQTTPMDDGQNDSEEIPPLPSSSGGPSFRGSKSAAGSGGGPSTVRSSLRSSSGSLYGDAKGTFKTQTRRELGDSVDQSSVAGSDKDFIKSNKQAASLGYMSRFYGLKPEEKARVEQIIGSDDSPMEEEPLSLLNLRLGPGFAPSVEEQQKLKEIEQKLLKIVPASELEKRLGDAWTPRGEGGDVSPSTSDGGGSKPKQSKGKQQKESEKEKEKKPPKDYLREMEEERQTRERLAEINRKVHELYTLPAKVLGEDEIQRLVEESRKDLVDSGLENLVRPRQVQDAFDIHLLAQMVGESSRPLPRSALPDEIAQVLAEVAELGLSDDGRVSPHDIVDEDDDE